MEPFNLKTEIEQICDKNMKNFIFPKIYIDINNNLYYNSLNSMCFSSDFINKNSIFYNNNEILKEIIALKKKLRVHDLYLEFDNNRLSLAICPVYNSISDIYFHDLLSEPFTLAMIKKISRENNKQERLMTLVGYLKLLTKARAFLIMQYFFFYNLIPRSELLDIYNEYVSYLNENFMFSTKNNKKLVQKALFKNFSMKEFNLD